MFLGKLRPKKKNECLTDGSQLPKELFSGICAELSARDVCAARLACQHWSGIFSSDEVWTDVLRKCKCRVYFNDLVERIEHERVIDIAILIAKGQERRRHLAFVTPFAKVPTTIAGWLPPWQKEKYEKALREEGCFTLQTSKLDTDSLTHNPKAHSKGFRICFVGETGCGKTATIESLKHGLYCDEYKLKESVERQMSRVVLWLKKTFHTDSGRREWTAGKHFFDIDLVEVHDLKELAMLRYDIAICCIDMTRVEESKMYIDRGMEDLASIWTPPPMVVDRGDDEDECGDYQKKDTGIKGEGEESFGDDDDSPFCSAYRGSKAGAFIVYVGCKSDLADESDVETYTKLTQARRGVLEPHMISNKTHEGIKEFMQYVLQELIISSEPRKRTACGICSLA